MRSQASLRCLPSKRNRCTLRLQTRQPDPSSQSDVGAIENFKKNSKGIKKKKGPSLAVLFATPLCHASTQKRFQSHPLQQNGEVGKSITRTALLPLSHRLDQVTRQQEVGNALFDMILMTTVPAYQFALGYLRLQQQMVQVSQHRLIGFKLLCRGGLFW